MNDSLNKLLDLGLEDIRIWKLYNGTIGLAYNNSYVTSGDWLTGAFGCGNTIEEAADDYVNKINNKVVVFVNEDELNEVNVKFD